jgi:hypothetical protein
VLYKPYGAVRHCTYVNQNSKLSSEWDPKIRLHQNIPTLYHDDPWNQLQYNQLQYIIGVGWIIMAGSRHKIGKHECYCVLYHCFLAHMVYHCCLVATGCHFATWWVILIIHAWRVDDNKLYCHPQAKHGNMVSF